MAGAHGQEAPQTHYIEGIYIEGIYIEGIYIEGMWSSC
jgi:hypothetical protein